MRAPTGTSRLTWQRRSLRALVGLWAGAFVSMAIQNGVCVLEEFPSPRAYGFSRFVIAVDTNVLVHAHRRDSAWHEPAFAAIRQLAEGSAAWCMPRPCVHFLAIVTHPKIWAPPSSVEKALAQVDIWLGAPTLVLLAEGDGHWDALRAVVQSGGITGPQLHEARVAAICAQHGVREIWTADRDFSRFPKLRTLNPLVG